MREPVRDRERLEHIVEAIDNILDFADDKTKEELEANKLRVTWGQVTWGQARCDLILDTSGNQQKYVLF